MWPIVRSCTIYMWSCTTSLLLIPLTLKLKVAPMKGLRTLIPLFVFYCSIPQFSKKIHYYSSWPALLFLLSWQIFVTTGRFLANFDFVISLHDTDYQELIALAESSESQSFERTTKACVLGYMANSSAAASSFTTVCSKTCFPKPAKSIIVISIVLALFLIPRCLLLFSKLFQHNLRRPTQ